MITIVSLHIIVNVVLIIITAILEKKIAIRLCLGKRAYNKSRMKLQDRLKKKHNKLLIRQTTGRNARRKSLSVNHINLAAYSGDSIELLEVDRSHTGLNAPRMSYFRSNQISLSLSQNEVSSSEISESNSSSNVDSHFDEF